MIRPFPNLEFKDQANAVIRSTVANVARYPVFLSLLFFALSVITLSPPPQHPPELPFPLNICEFKYGRWFGSAVFLRLQLKLGPGDPVRSGPAVPSQTLSKYHMIDPPPPHAPAPGNGGLERNTATTLELPPHPTGLIAQEVVGRSPV